MPEGSGVRLADATRPHGPSTTKRPADGGPDIGSPCCCGVWHSVQAAMVARYAPRFTGVAMSGAGTACVVGCGAFRIRYGKGSARRVVGNGGRTGGKVPRNTTID